MTHPLGGFRMIRLSVTAAAVALGLAAPSAHAGVLVKTATNCPNETLEQPFLRWADPAHYVLAPAGTIETTTGWRLSGAQQVLGNEPWYVHAAGEKRSLALRAGSSATTARMCVGLEHPTLRLFARNTGSPLSLLKVEVLVETRLGLVQAVPIGELAATSSWGPTLPLPLLANLLAVPPADRTAVRFRFTPQGAGNWQIDDVYVDPYRR